MSLTIRRADLTEERAIRSFLDSVVPCSLEGQGHDLGAIVENVNGNIDKWAESPKDSAHYIAEVDGRIVGVILIKDYWNLCSLFVQPEFQHQGIGTALVEIALMECREKSPGNAVFLNANVEAVAFYKKIGFGFRDVSTPLPVGSTAMKLSF